MLNCFMCWVTKRHERVDGSIINAEFVVFGVQCQHTMKAEMVNQRSHAFPTTTTHIEKKHAEKRTLTITKGLQHWISTEGKSAHLFIGSMSAQGKDTKCQRCGAVVAVSCRERGKQQ